MFDCDKITEYISLYADGEIKDNSEEMKAILSHIETCDECKLFFDNIMFLKDSLNDMIVAPPENLHEKIMSAVNDEMNGQIIEIKRPNIVRYMNIAVVAAVICIVVVTSSFLHIFDSTTSFDSSSSTTASMPMVLGIEDTDSAVAVMPSVAFAMGIESDIEADAGENEEANDDLELEESIEPDLQLGTAVFDESSDKKVIENTLGAEITFTLPDELSDTSFGYYLITSLDEVPDIEATLVLERDSIAYYEISNSITLMESLTKTLDEAGAQILLVTEGAPQLVSTAEKSLLVIKKVATVTNSLGENAASDVSDELITETIID